MALFSGICVIELPALRGGEKGGAGGTTAVTSAPGGPRTPMSAAPTDLENLSKMPYHYDYSAEEFTFTLTPRDAPRMNGYVRRYRVANEALGGRVDLTPYTSSRASDMAAVPAYQAICILSERPYHRFFSQCLQLLHAARLAGGPAALALARTLLAFNSAPNGAIIPLRSLINAPRVPGTLSLPKERLRVPISVGLPYFDVPLAPLLNRLDAPALMMLYVAMLCERRIIFVGQSISTLTSCVHAAIALMQPFEWLNIFIPVLPSSFLMYCTAPNPYVIGLTPAQFTQLNEEYEIGDIVLVALDEGYVACLNSALPLPDLEGPNASNNNTGFISYSGPKYTSTGAPGVPSGTESPSTFMSYFGGAPGSTPVAAATESTGGMSTAASTPADDSQLSPFHSPTRTHAYDDEFVRARHQRKAFAQRRLLARRRGKEMINKIFNKDTNSDGLRKIREREQQKRQELGLRGTSDFDFGTGTFTSPPAVASGSGWGTFTPDAASVAAATKSAPASGATVGAVPISAGGAADIAAAAKKAAPIIGGSQAVIPETELDGSLSNEIGTINLGVDLKALVSRPGDEDSVRKRKAAAARRMAALPAELAGLDMAAMAAKRDTTKSLGQRLALGKMTAALFSLATGSATSEDPGIQLALNIRKVYEKEKREGWFDESALYACMLSFVALVFGRVGDFVHVDADSASHGPSRLDIPGANLRFAKEDFVKFTVRHPCIARLLDEAQHAQWLQTFAVEWHLKQTHPPKDEAPAKMNVVDIAMAEAAAAAMIAPSATGSIGRSTNSLGSMSLTGSGSFGLTGAGTSASLGQSSNGPGALLGAAANFVAVMRKLYGALVTVTETLADAPPLGSASGVAGTAHTVSTALSGLLYASSCVTAVSGKPPTLPPHLPELTLPLVVTALRGLLSASTSSTLLPEESHTQIVRIAAAATHDPILVNVVLGVIWNRINDCSDKSWQHGYKALVLLYALLRVGSARVCTLAITFLPVLRFLIHPARVLAVRAGYVAEEMGGQASNVSIVQGANVLARARKGMFGPAAIPGLALSTATNPLSAINSHDGMLMVARQAARVYLLLAQPRRWMLERAVAVGPAGISFGAPITVPLLYPLVHPASIYATGDFALPPGWLPTPKEPLPPSGRTGSDGVADEGRAAGARDLSDIQKQPRAADAPWEQVHRVATPCIASSRSRALAALSVQLGIRLSSVLTSPESVQAAIKAAKERKIAENPATMAAAAGRAGGPARPRRMRDALVSLSRSSALKGVVKVNPTPALPTVAPTFAASFEAFSPHQPPAPVTSHFPEANPFDFVEPTTPATLPVPSSEFDVFGASRQKVPTPAAASGLDFDSWATPAAPTVVESRADAPAVRAPSAPAMPAAVPDPAVVQNGGVAVNSPFDFAPEPISGAAPSTNSPFDFPQPAQALVEQLDGNSPFDFAPPQKPSTAGPAPETSSVHSPAVDAFGFPIVDPPKGGPVNDPFAF